MCGRRSSPGEHVVQLDLDVIDIRQGRSQGDQPGDGGPSDDCGLRQDEVIGRLGLELPGLARSGQRPEPTVRGTGAEGKGLRPGGRREPHPGGQRRCY